ncbi:hypothetical protein [Abyssibacter profundi]|uniref:Uncharacterized protein n=1 Tax=Abyssibacter profundi TaxID=2182787 RepID=A0A363UNP3_9GAMM|nr:hypothetical protein [Abyssibacter profundi]MBV60104.1 hypothetical protein [Nevskiales bacterium]PWN57034.1 hypothetical protein DEH80_03595 [Abyssibacter profundi]|tara:strand:- start:252 stop:437 length:186 start_codon:yes stop_codon:yes gene_type:complete
MSRSDDDIDWSLTTFEGVRIEQMRRWAELPLDRIVAALEEMEQYAARRPGNVPVNTKPEPS